MAVSVDNGRAMLRAFGFDAERSTERAALVLLSLLGLTPGDPWATATNAAYGTRALMDHVATHWGTRWAPNTRETVRRFTLHQFVAAGLVEHPLLEGFHAAAATLQQQRELTGDVVALEYVVQPHDPFEQGRFVTGMIEKDLDERRDARADGGAIHHRGPAPDDA